jgi:hypothetical protein
MTREWPERCQRCQDRGLECSAPERVDQYRARSQEPEKTRPPEVPVRSRVNTNRDPLSHSLSASNGPRSFLGNDHVSEPEHGVPSNSNRLPSLVEAAGGAYKYKRLQRGEIRIAHLLPASSDAVVEVEISREPLDAKIASYQALSWYAGPDNHPDQEIYIKNPTVKLSGHKPQRTWPLKVKHNLWTGLKRLRHHRKVIRLWVDLICIDHFESKSDLDDSRDRKFEKSEQICLMSYLFAYADKVVVWIGEPENADEGVEILGVIDKIMGSGEEYLIAGLDETTFRRSISVSELQSFLKFLQQPWFTRRLGVQVSAFGVLAWRLSLLIELQEIGSSKSAIVRYGNQSVDWDKLANAISLLEAVSRSGNLIQDMMKETTNQGLVPQGTASISSLPAYRLVQNTYNIMIGKNEGTRNLRWLYTLEELVSFLPAFKPSSLHDTIYAVLGISCDFQPVPAQSADDTYTPPQQPVLDGTWYAPRDLGLDFGKRTPFRVDYDLDPLVLFKKFVKMTMKKSGTMDILCRPWAPVEGRYTSGGATEFKSPPLPSWIPTLDRKPFQPDKHKRMIRVNPDPLVGPPVKRQKYNNASGAREIQFMIDLADQSSNRLTVKGFVLDTVGQIWDAANFGNVPGRWLKAAGNWMSEDEPPPRELWRTLVADRGVNGYDPPDLWYPLVLQTAVKQSGIDYGFLTQDMIDRTRSNVARVFRRIQAVVWNRRMIRTKGDFLRNQGVQVNFGVLGLAPEKVEVGDLIVILFGCSVPLLLRPTCLPRNKPPPSTQPRYSAAPEVAVNEPQIDPNREFGAHAGSRFEDQSETQRATPRMDMRPVPRSDHRIPLSETPDPVPENGDCVDDDYDDVARDETYNLVGECYIDGMMDGQAMDYFELRKNGARWFNIE